jgi:GntR family transcriptional repressor for pyruvate dehydrogenase complex
MPNTLTTPSPIRRKKISDIVVEAIENFIITNELREGDKLPSEKDLAGLLEVGTRLVREALKVLEARGVIDVLQGKGAYVAGKSKENFTRALADSLRFTLTLDKDLLFELMYVRTIIESSVAADIAAKRTEEDVARISEILVALEAAYKEKDIAEYNRLDVLFHKQIVDSADNRILTTLYEKLTSLLLTSFNKTGYMRGSTKESIKQHRELLEAIRGRDESGARTTMSTHLMMSAERLRAHMAGLDKPPAHGKKTSKRGSTSSSAAPAPARGARPGKAKARD